MKKKKVRRERFLFERNTLTHRNYEILQMCFVMQCEIDKMFIATDATYVLALDK